MGHRSGIGGQLGFVAETTYGTFVVPTRFLEFNTEGLVFNRETIQSAGIRRGSNIQRTSRWAVNKKGGGGPVTFELASKGFGLLLKHAMGAVTITTPGGATLQRRHRHVFGDLDDLSLTIQKGAPDIGATTNPFTFLGCVVTGWELGVDVDGLVMFTPTFDAQDMVTAQALAVAAYPAADELFSYQQTAVTVNAGGVTPTGMTLSVDHGMKTDRFFVQNSALKKRPVIAARRAVTGTLTFEFESMTQVNFFLNAAPGAEVPIGAVIRGSQIDAAPNYYGLDVIIPKARFDGEIPVIQGPDVLTVSAPFEVLDDGTNEELTLDYFTTDVAS
ncbi:phage tail tube protein [Miltoncostaea oceani]|uniref:phage tail tube protein n=1 Tax=Miltoncostaea oceani TaxID=2843216 RepID=UPI001C3DE932|nr:phage tail tube protein [Miltoncostaea oceani]